jgi:neutral ceramidase
VAAFPSEITTQAGRRIRDAVARVAAAQAPEGAIIAGLTNSYNSYTATPEEYEACHYEGSFTLWGRRQGARYRDLARALAKSLFGGAAPPSSAPEPPEVSPGTAQPPSVRSTPDAGTVVENVATEVPRLGQARFKWNGGDPAIDAPRGKTFVTLERKGPNGFAPVATEDSVLDVTEHGRGDTWTETWQFTECDALGTYRFVVRGVANRGGGAAPYRVESKPFELRKSAALSVFSKTIGGGAAHVRAEYGGYPDRPLSALPHRVRSGFAVVRLKLPGGVTERIALPDADRLEFTTPVPPGATIQSVAVEDGCGNTG